MALDMWKKKAGPLPMWGWGAIILAAALLWSLGQSRAAAKSSADDTSTTGSEVQTVPADQVPDFISQVYSTTINNLPSPAGTPPPADTTTPPTKTAPPVSPPKVTTPKPPPKVTPAAPKKPVSYKVKSGDTLSSIAKKYGTTWQALWTYNTTAGVRPADTIKTLKSRGPNLLYSGETILIPQK